MNRDWDTPANGDFARYVERLTAQALVAGQRGPAESLIDAEGPKDTASQVRAHQLGAGMAQPQAEAAPPQAPRPVKALKNALIGFIVLMVVLNVGFQVPVLVLLGIAAMVGWVGFKARRMLLGDGAEAMRERIERASREARNKRS